MRYLYLSIIIFALSGSGRAQTTSRVNIDLPHFAGKPYVFFLMQGGKQDTIQRGALDEKGKTLLTLPEQYQSFTGMSKFMIVGEGGLEIILNREPEFTVSCAEALPNMSNIHYIGTPENNFLFGQYQKQGKILDKARVIEMALQLYNSPKDSLYRHLKTEQNLLQNQFAKLQTETARSPLYAARFREMSDFLQGLGSRLTLTEKEMRQENRKFIPSKIDFEQLYNSGLWNDVLDKWIGMETAAGDSLLLADCRTALNRYTDKELHGRLLGKLILLYNKYGKENLLPQLGVDDALTPGHPAPKLHLETGYMTPAGSLVIFYESGCSSCETELAQLRTNYATLQEKGLRVISISADFDEAIYRKNADLFPWPDKYCDYKGFAGENFSNYQALGTPTIFVIDKNGIITGRYAHLAEAINTINKN